MKVLLGIFTYAKGSDTLARHWPYFERQQADRICCVKTTDSYCVLPDVIIPSISIGRDSYLDGPHLPVRLLDTIKNLLDSEWDVLMLCEYDTVIFKRLPLEQMSEPAAAHLAGHLPDYHFYHNPWCITRGMAQDFLDVGYETVINGTCCYGSKESSPDVFFGLVCKLLGITVQHDLWREFSRNRMDNPGDLDLARACYRDGFSVIHGVKTAAELEYICGTSI